MTLNPQMQWMLFLGSLALEWTDIERMLDLWVEEIHKAGGEKRIQAQLPPNLDRELDYLSDAFKCGLMDPSLNDEGRRIIQETHRLKNFRHDVIHGSTIVEKGRVICSNWRVRGASRMRLTTTYTVNQQWRRYSQTRQLRHDLRVFLFGKDETKPSG